MVFIFNKSTIFTKDMSEYNEEGSKYISNNNNNGDNNDGKDDEYLDDEHEDQNVKIVDEFSVKRSNSADKKKRKPKTLNTNPQTSSSITSQPGQTSVSSVSRTNNMAQASKNVKKTLNDKSSHPRNSAYQRSQDDQDYDNENDDDEDNEDADETYPLSNSQHQSMYQSRNMAQPPQPQTNKFTKPILNTQKSETTSINKINSPNNPNPNNANNMNTMGLSSTQMHRANFSTAQPHHFQQALKHQAHQAHTVPKPSMSLAGNHYGYEVNIIYMKRLVLK